MVVVEVKFILKFMVVVLRGKEIELGYEDIKRVSKRRIRGDRKTKYYAIVEGKKYPVKRLLYEVLKEKGYDFTLQDFTTEDAIRILKRLGVEIKEAKNLEEQVSEKEKGNKAKILRYAGVFEMGGNAVEDEQKLYSS